LLLVRPVPGAALAPGSRIGYPGSWAPSRVGGGRGVEHGGIGVRVSVEHSAVFPTRVRVIDRFDEPARDRSRGREV